ncbi:MAG: zinc metalloprotease HtpX [Candidatus Zambryskibacteria bacterium CG11_big_fil_rev_8_21_14_0_20_42_18]|uniref:Protease HtpX homolog n=1 Tax=Candidatus Zambryskibacteria bacterium CG_4_9_14_3_um_filter_42_15 TaxID=1975112 RepID=A0A2M7WR87_9BACT|nr:MAG: zinc metalloprotease HtpX [Candidatus Zambryskibacteria bacterium CG11_big_fil_rev_8_21_14_0_20_42_18]PJA32520.1 MAG: zinc metalloprotease HtpX [Candidatus Zambryskibacteria bacterium CG_4_9_14_3_um_filter_42_15]
MTFFFVFVIFLGWFVSYYFQNPALLYVAVFFAIFMNVFSYWYSDKIVLKLHKAKVVVRAEHFDLWNAVENLSITAGLPMPKLYIIEDPAPNAFATGRNKDHAVVAVTTGLLAILDKNELEGVIAHELSHIGNKDMLLSTVVVVLVGFIALLSDFFLRAQMFGNMRSRDNGGRAGAILLVIGIAFAILAPLVATLIRLAISRKREFLADASGALLTRYPDGLASALKKISSAPTPMRTANNATAHLFISNPFGGKKKSLLHKLFMTHPPTEDRVRALVGK